MGVFKMEQKLVWLAVVGLKLKDAEATEVNVVCHADDSMVLKLPYATTFDIVNVEYGSCTLDGDKISAGVSAEQDVDFEVTVDKRSCLGSGDGDTVTIHFGRLDATTGDKIVMETAKVNATCSFADSYEARYVYSGLALAPMQFTGSAGIIALEFVMKSYSSDYSEVLPDDTPYVGGKRVHLGLEVTSSKFSYCTKTYAPKRCIVRNGNGDTYTLFDISKGPTCQNNVIDLQMGYNVDQSIWTIEHTLFLINDDTKSSYVLECSVIVCDTSARGNACETVANACLTPANARKFTLGCVKTAPVAEIEALGKQLKETTTYNPTCSYTDTWHGEIPENGDIAQLAGAYDDDFESITSTSFAITASDQIAAAATTRWAVPTEYDLRSHETCGSVISAIRDQGTCSSCWAFTTAGVSNDVLCLASGGAHQKLLSPQQMHGCCQACMTNPGVCNEGGSTAQGFLYFLSNGLVTGADYQQEVLQDHGTGCYPYEWSGSGVNHFQSTNGNTATCSQQCTGSHALSYSQDVRGAPSRYITGALVELSLAQRWIMIYGSVAMVFEVRHDFFVYESGVYTVNSGSPLAGLHAVRVIGWGTVNGVDYWLCANSWGSSWGENGFFKIKRGSNEADSERRGFLGIATYCDQNSNRLLNEFGQCVG